MSFRKISSLLTLLMAFALPSIAQETPYDLRSLVGIRASSGEMELPSRGFVFVKASDGGGRRFSNFWNDSRRLCITVATFNGRYDSIVTSPPFDCNRESVGNAGGPASASVTVYEDRDYRGRSQTFSDGRYLNNGGTLGNLRNDRASSIDIPVGFSARLCDGEGSGNGSGVCLVFEAGRYNLPASLDNRVSYVEVTQVLFGGGGSSGGNPGGTGNSEGSAVWAGRVDMTARIMLQSTRIWSQDVSGTGMQISQETMNGFIPRSDTTVSVTKLSGRGTVSVIQQPNRSNNYTAIVQINDSRSGAANYELSMSWSGDGSGDNPSPVNVSDLVGARASSGESEMRSRGFRLVDTLRSANTIYSIWWRAQSRQYIQAATANGRYDSITDISSHPRCN